VPVTILYSYSIALFNYTLYSQLEGRESSFRSRRNQSTRETWESEHELETKVT